MSQELKTTQVKSLEDQFDDAASKVYYLPDQARPLWPLQASDCWTSEHSPSRNPQPRAKWDAWKAVEEKSKDEAMKDYIAKIKEIF